MNEALVRRVKNSLNSQHYSMNDSWLSEGIEYYLSEHANASQEEIVTFVMNQWILQDLRDINNEKGCLPRGLAEQKSSMLSGKYILQVDKMYDISQSKYKQLEKIRNVSIENVEATERENAQEDKFQNFEPKSKRMYELFLTDGVQDVCAIEYRPIRFLKETLIPGFKVMLKGPVRCKRGVILLEETNIEKVGGEVDSLLIANAVENVFARALNLEENPDPYNDTKKTQNNQTQSTQADDDFDIDSQVLEQIDKQVKQQISGISENTVSSSLRYSPSQRSITNTSNPYQRQNSSTINKTQKINTPGTKSQQSLSSTTVNRNKTPQQKQGNAKMERVINFEDDGDSFLEMVDDKAFKNIPASKPTFKIPSLPTPLNIKSSTLPKVTPNLNDDDFPTDDEMYDLTESFTTSDKSNSQSKTNLSNMASCRSTGTSKNNTHCMGNKDKTLKSVSNQTPSRSGNSNLPQKPYPTNKFSIPDDDLDLGDVNMEIDDFNDYLKKKDEAKASTARSSQSSISSSKLKDSNIDFDCLSHSSKSGKISKHSSGETKSDLLNDSLQKMDLEFDDEFDVEFEAVENKDFKSCIDQKIDGKKFKATETKYVPVRSKDQKQSNFSEQIGNKRSREATSSSSSEEIPQKVPRVAHCTPKSSKSGERKITDFLTSPGNSTSSAKNNHKQSPLLSEDGIKCCEFLKDALKLSIKDSARIIVRGKVKNIVKLNLLKNEKGSYFHLEGTISDDTANLDVIFSSEVLEKIIGYSTQEFSRKRKQSKTDPNIKEQLREDLKKAQRTLTVMDELMEIELKKNEKAVIVNSVKLTKEQKKSIDDKVRLLNAR